MTTAYAEFLDKAQAEFVSGLKQAQELNIKQLTAANTLVAAVPSIETNDTPSLQFPTPTEIVERVFAFTSTILEARKEYALKLAEFATEAQKQFIDSAKRVSEAAKV